MRALLVGGPRDGEVMEIPDDHDMLTVPGPWTRGVWEAAALADDAPLRPQEVPATTYRLDERLLPRIRGTHVVFRVWRGR